MRSSTRKPSARACGGNVKQQIATSVAASRALAVFLMWVIIITSIIIIVVVITNPLALISSYTITDFFLFAIALVLAIARYCDRDKQARRSAEI
jgi:hypothetical protein